MVPTTPSDPPRAAEPSSARALKPTLLVAAPLILGLHGFTNLMLGLIWFRERNPGALASLQPGAPTATTNAVVAVGIMALGGMVLVAAWGFWANRLWARPLILIYGAIVTAVSFLVGARMGGPLEAVGSSLTAALITSFLWSYLYDSSSAGSYYARLEEEAAGRGS